MKSDNKYTMNLMDVETGRIHENIVKIISKNQDIYFNTKLKTTEENKDFVKDYGQFVFKVNSKQVDKIQDNISNSDIAKIIYCATYLDYNNILRLDDNKPIYKKDLMKIVGVNKNVFYKWYNDMIKYKILIETESKQLKMNIKYCIKGKLSKNKKYNRLFINSVRNIYEYNKGKNMKTLGHIYTLLPYINYKTNILCWNPNEEDESKIKGIKIKELSEIFSEYKKDYKTLIKNLCSFTIEDNLPIITTFGGDGILANEYLVFNPLLTYSGYNKDLAGIDTLFKFLSKNSENENISQNTLKSSDTNGLSAPKKGVQNAQKRCTTKSL